MNTGIFGEGFPYSNFHDLNMDWIIKIAKDFLDQYTHIQQVIVDGETSLQNLTESGLQQLQDKADNLEELLQAWYNDHSEDIANQLADALSDLNSWYNEHSEDIANELADSIAEFNTAAEAKAAETIASIPDDYTTLATKVQCNRESLVAFINTFGEDVTNLRDVIDPGFINNDGSISTSYAGWLVTGFIRYETDTAIVIQATTDTTILVQYLDINGQLINDYKRIQISVNTDLYTYIPSNYGYYYRIAIEKASISKMVEISLGYLANIDKHLQRDKWIRYLDKESFNHNYFNVNGTFSHNASLNDWWGHRKLLPVGNAKELIFFHSFTQDVQFNIFKYNANREPITGSLEQVRVAPNKYFLYSVPNGNQYYAISLNIDTYTDETIDDISPVVWMRAYNCVATDEESTIPNIPEFAFDNYLTVGQHNEEYSDIGVAYNVGNKKNFLIVSPGSIAQPGNGFQPNTIYMKGSGKYATRIYNDSCIYPYSAMSLMGEACVEDVYFKAGNSSTSANGGYAIHMESNNYQGKTVIFKNCVFEAEWQSGFGVGLRKNCHLIFENCHFLNDWEITSGTNELTPEQITKAGGLFFHGSIDSENLGIQHITLINCVVESKGAGALRIEDVPGNTVIATFINCNFFSKYYGVTNPIDIVGGIEPGYLCGSTVKLGAMSHGNNIPQLNSENYKY